MTTARLLPKLELSIQFSMQQELINEIPPTFYRDGCHSNNLAFSAGIAVFPDERKRLLFAKNTNELSIARQAPVTFSLIACTEKLFLTQVALERYRKMGTMQFVISPRDAEHDVIHHGFSYFDDLGIVHFQAAHRRYFTWRIDYLGNNLTTALPRLLFS